MIVGYARVSTDQQKLDLQLAALEKAGCDRIFTDLGVSGAVFERDGLDAALESLQPGDTLVVWRLDRLGRSLTGLVNVIEWMVKRDVHFRSIMENVETVSSGGRLMFHMLAALAEFERSIISERTRAGLSAARARGKRIGRPKALTEEQILEAQAILHDGELSLPDIARELGVSTRTLRTRLREARGELSMMALSERHARPLEGELIKPPIGRKMLRAMPRRSGRAKPAAARQLGKTERPG